MKNILKLSILALLIVFTINHTFAGASGPIRELDYKYNGSLIDYPIDTQLSIQGYINPYSVGFSDGGFGGIKIKNLNYFNLSKEYLGIKGDISFGTFYPQSEVKTKEVVRSDGSVYYTRKFDYNFNNGLILYATKNFIESLNINDPSYFIDYKKNKIYNNGSIIKNNNFSNYKGGLDLKGLIVKSTGGNSNTDKSNIVIEGKIKQIDINEKIYFCDQYYKNYKGEYKINGNETCKKITSKLKKDFYKGLIDSETFKELFIKTWESNAIKEIKINTKIFLLNGIIIDGKKYGYNSLKYNLNNKLKTKFNKILNRINKLPNSKKEKIIFKINEIINKFKYGSKNYEILSYLKNGIENYYFNEKKKEAEIILNDIKNNHEYKEIFTLFLNNLMGSKY